MSTSPTSDVGKYKELAKSSRSSYDALPRATKTEATLKALKKLHPEENNPTPMPHREVVRFSPEVVRKALCSFSPGSATGLFGHKPLLLQQCMRAKSFVFGRVLTAAVNHFAAGLAPKFLRKYFAG